MEWLGGLETTGSPPTPRKGHTMTRLLDSSVVLVYGGEDNVGNFLSDMYSLHVEREEWRRITYAAGPCPPARLLHTATAISSTAMVVFGGDSQKDVSEEKVSASSNEAWVFDIRDCSWREIKGNGGQVPPPRSCHSAVLGTGPGLVPAIYIFGGFGGGVALGSAVFRLRIGDWKWECLSVVVKDSDGSEKLIESVLQKPSSKKGKRIVSPEGYPGTRESHGALWVPGLNGMIIVGGDGGVTMLDDCWVFSPALKPGTWQWKQVKLRMAKGLTRNKLPMSAGHSLSLLPTGTSQILMWGGIMGRRGEHVMGADFAYIIDLEAMQTTRIAISGKVSKQGRLLHGLVRFNERLIAFGGCDGEGKVLTGVEAGRLLSKLLPVGHMAADFGPAAVKVATGGEELAESPSGVQTKEEWTEGSMEYEEEDEEYMPLVGPSSIPKGTPLSGRIIDVTDFGYFVSVVINGKLYKGVLVANPLKRNPNDAEEGQEAQSNATEKALEVPSSKRPRLDPLADLLPDPDESPQTPASGVITLD